MHRRCWEVTDISNEIALVFIAPLFFGISFIYSSVGFGGGSSYIAILVLFGISLFAVPPIAQILNIIVAGIAMISFARAKHLSLKFSLPFLSSVPFAFFAGTIALPEQQLTLIFVLALFGASAALLLSGIRGRFEKLQEKNAKGLRLWDIRKIVLIGIPTGGILGVVAGLVGIGGGIWLSPLLILSRMADPKRAAATSSIFIVAVLLPLALVVLAGGLLGSTLGALRLDHDKIRIIVGAIVAIAGFNLMIKFFFS